MKVDIKAARNTEAEEELTQSKIQKKLIAELLELNESEIRLLIYYLDSLQIGPHPAPPGRYRRPCP